MAGSALDLPAARKIAQRALEHLESDADLDEIGWSAWVGMFEEFAACDELETCCRIEPLRYGLEEVAGCNEPADLCLAALKLALSAFVVVGQNPYYPAGYAEYTAWCPSDVDTLVRKAEGLLEQALRFDPSPFPITRNKTVVAKVQGHQQRTWLGNMLESAVRPGDTEDADGFGKPSLN